MKWIPTFLILLGLGVGPLFSQPYITIPRLKLSLLEQQADTYYEAFRDNNRLPDSVFFHEGGPFVDYQRFLFIWRPRLEGHGEFENYFENEKIYKQYIKTAGRSAICVQGNDWWEIGPYEPPQGTMSSNGGSHTGAGPVHFLLIHPVENNYMLTGSRTGGLFYSTNSGVTWQNSGSDTQWDKSGCANAAFNASNPEKWYAVSNGWEPFMGWSGGVYRTLDAGVNWDKVGDANTFGVWTRAFKIIVDPGSGDKACVATNNGLFTTSNLNAGTVNWDSYSQRKFPNNWVYDVELRPGTSSELYATVANSTIQLGNNQVGTDYQIWKSTDFGQNWTLLSGVPGTFFPGVGLTIEFNPQKPDQFYVLNNRNLGSCTAIYSGTCDKNDELWRYDISGNSWTLLDSDWDISHGGGNGFAVANDGTNEVVYGSHVDRYRVFVNGAVSLYNTSVSNKSQYHVDIEDFAPHPNNSNEVWIACHGGVFKSVDQGENWIARSTGLGVAEPHGFAASYTDPGLILTGLFHDGSILTQTGYYNNWGPTWYLKGEGDGATSLIDNIDPTHMFLSAQNGSWRRSNNMGASFNAPVGYVGGNWWTNGILNKIDPSIFYRATGPNGEVSRSFDRGVNNAIVSDFGNLLGLSSYNVFQVYNGANEEDYLYARIFDSDGKHVLVVNKQINNSNPTTVINAWQELPLPTNILSSCSGNYDFYFNDLFVDHDNPDIVYLTANSSSSCVGSQLTGTNMVIKADYTVPNSPVFTDLTFDLPNNRGGPIALEKGSDGGMYLATDWGVYYTNNKRISDGNSPVWCLFGPNLPHVQPRNLEINYTINKIRIALLGRGVWENDLICPDDYDLVESGTYFIDAYLEAEHNISSTASVISPRTVTYRAGNIISLKPGFRALSGSDFHAFIHPCNKPGNSFFKDNTEASEEKEEELVEASPRVEAYPNPNQGEFTLALDKQMDLESLSLQIFDLNGRMVLSLDHVPSHKVPIAIPNAARGQYVIRLTSLEFQESLRIIVLME